MRLPKLTSGTTETIPTGDVQTPPVEPPSHEAGDAFVRDGAPPIAAPAQSGGADVIALVSKPLPQRRLPPLSKALASAEVRAIDPAELYPVPDAIVARLAQAKKVLVIGHVPPDGDCVGSAIGLARLMRALGKQADACIDDHIPGNLRKMDDDPAHPVKRADQLDDDYDLVVVVDVAAAQRIGGAAAAVARAPEVMVIDHHHVEATHETMEIAADVPLTTWVVPTADSASLLLAGAASKLAAAVPDRPIAADHWARITLPLAVGTFTDTDGFARPGATMPALQGFKHMVERGLAGDVEPVKRILDYHLPRTAARLLQGPLREHRGIRGELADRLRALIAAELHVERELSRDQNTALIIAPRKLTDLVLDVARTDEPETTINDVRGHILHELDRLPRDHKLAVLLFEERGDVLVSTRSQDPGPALDLARAVARELGGSGNGHLHMAGANPPAGLEETADMVRGWLAKWRLERDAKLRLAGNR